MVFLHISISLLRPLFHLFQPCLYLFVEALLSWLLKISGNCNIFVILVLTSIFFTFYLLILERGREKEKHQFVVPLISVFINCFLYVPWLGIKSATLAYQNDALTNWATWPGQCWHLLIVIFFIQLRSSWFLVWQMIYLNLNIFILWD